MAKAINKVYAGHSHIISSLAEGTDQNFDAVLDFKTNITSHSDGTPLCKIQRSGVCDLAQGGYSFAEQLAIRCISRVEAVSQVALDSSRTAIILSTTKGNVEMLDNDFEQTYLWSSAHKIKDYFGCERVPMVISTACISGVAAVVVAARMIEDGEVDNVYVVGVDVLSDFIVEGFNSFKSISPTVCRPYDVARDGLTLGEGCGVILLTNDIEKSQSKIVIAGGGLSNDANHISGPSRTGDGLHYAISAAMKQAGVESNNVGYINMHGTGTAYNDDMESKAAQLSGLQGVPCNSLKPYFGHTLGASGVIEIIMAVEQIKRNVVLGVKGYSVAGVPCPLNVSSEHRECSIEHAIKTASGFGGTNAAVVLSRLSEQENCTVEDVEIIRVGHIEIIKNEQMPFVDFIKNEYRGLGDTNLKFFKMDGLSKLGYVASCKLMQSIEEPLGVAQNRVSVVLANRSASLQSDIKHQSVVNERLPEGASPAIFVYTLPNIVAAEIAIKHKFRGESIFLVEQNKSMDMLSSYAHRLIERGVSDAVLFGWCELLGEDYNVELTLIKKKI